MKAYGRLRSSHIRSTTDRQVLAPMIFMGYLYLLLLPDVNVVLKAGEIYWT